MSRGPLTPDVTVWEALGSWFSLLGGATAVALQTSLVALLVGACAWALGVVMSIDRLATGGKLCVVGALCVAFVAPMLAPWVGWLIDVVAW